MELVGNEFSGWMLLTLRPLDNIGSRDHSPGNGRERVILAGPAHQVGRLQGRSAQEEINEDSRLQLTDSVAGHGLEQGTVEGLVLAEPVKGAADLKT